ncbi:MAG: tryptophan synthase subunit alpha [Elusimicrobiota bacterium]
MNRLEKKVLSLKKQKKKALITYITAGYPSAGATEGIFRTLVDSGADIVELGIPFSDPIADGPTIQRSSDQALKNGMSLDKIFQLVKKIRRNCDTPVILMGYLNPLMRNGIERTAELAGRSGVDGFIVPDLIPEESDELRKIFKKHGVSLIFLAAPNTPAGRLKSIARYSDPFVYIVSLTGVTGGRKNLPKDLITFLARTKSNIRKPRYIGFGISRAEQVRSLKKYVDGVIVGSAVIDILTKYRSADKRTKKLSEFVRSLKCALV